MKKILSILRGKKQTERLSELRSQEIMRALDSALNNVEEQKVLADIRYHEEINNLGDDGVFLLLFRREGRFQLRATRRSPPILRWRT